VISVHVNKTRAELVWAEIFPQLETALVHLPALREIRALPCEWPTTEDHDNMVDLGVQPQKHW
jgi:hypothetical protein